MVNLRAVFITQLKLSTTFELGEQLKKHHLLDKRGMTRQ